MLIIYSSDPNFKSIRLDVECYLGEYVSIEDERLLYWAFYFAKGVIKCRWADIGKPEIEDIIGKDPKWAYWYAIDVLYCRWADIGKKWVEDVIGKDPVWAFYYAEDVLKWQILKNQI